MNHKWTHKDWDELFDAYEATHSRKEACRKVGIPYRTFIWAMDNEPYVQRKWDETEKGVLLSIEDKVLKRALMGRDAKVVFEVSLAKWALSRRMPERWGRGREMLTGNEDMTQTLEDMKKFLNEGTKG